MVGIWSLWLCYKQGHLGVGNDDRDDDKDDQDDDDEDDEKDDDDGLQRTRWKDELVPTVEPPMSCPMHMWSPSCLLYSLVAGFCCVE